MLTVFACLFVVLFFRQCEKEDEMVRERKRWDVWMRELIIEQSEKGALCVVFFFSKFHPPSPCAKNNKTESNSSNNMSVGPSP